MKLSDIMSAAGLSSYAEIALVLFLLAFLGVVVSLFLPSRQRMYERMRHLPIDRETAVPAPGSGDVDVSSPQQPLSKDDCDSSLGSLARNDNHA